MINRDFKTSRASGANAKENTFRDILIYPILHAPNAIDFLDSMSLKDAFWQFVLCDPEVQFLGSKAIKANPELKRVYLEGWCYPRGCREWPLAFAHGSLAGGRAQNPFYGTQAWKRLRAHVLIRDGHKCIARDCRTPSRGVGGRLIVDHVVERRKGGADHPSNLRTLCPDCDNRRHGRRGRGA